MVGTSCGWIKALVLQVHRIQYLHISSWQLFQLSSTCLSWNPNSEIILVNTWDIKGENYGLSTNNKSLDFKFDVYNNSIIIRIQEVRSFGDDAISSRIFTPFLAFHSQIVWGILTPLLGRHTINTFHLLMYSIRITWGIIKTKTSGSFHERFFVIKGQSHWDAQQNYCWCDALAR